jgi:hypothetical protein
MHSKVQGIEAPRMSDRLPAEVRHVVGLTMGRPEQVVGETVVEDGPAAVDLWTVDELNALDHVLYDLRVVQAEEEVLEVGGHEGVCREVLPEQLGIPVMDQGFEERVRQAVARMRTLVANAGRPRTDRPLPWYRQKRGRQASLGFPWR